MCASSRGKLKIKIKERVKYEKNKKMDKTISTNDDFDKLYFFILYR